VSIYQNIVETIGNTPIIKINKLAPKGINLFDKQKDGTFTELLEKNNINKEQKNFDPYTLLPTWLHKN